MTERQYMNEPEPVEISHFFEGQQFRLLEFETIQSTNTYLKKCAPDKLGVIVSAETQTAGRGRLDRNWLKTGEQLLFSFAFKTTLKEIPFVSLIAGLSVYSALSVYQPEIRLKWPNDVLLHGKKICGILCESFFNLNANCIIIGVGINLYQNGEIIPEEIRNKAGYLFSGNSTELISKRDIKCDIYQRFMELLKDLKTQTISKEQCIEKWQSCSCSIGKQIKITDGEKVKTGTFQSLDENGFIQLLEDNANLTTIRTGDVEFI